MSEREREDSENKPDRPTFTGQIVFKGDFSNDDEE